MVLVQCSFLPISKACQAAGRAVRQAFHRKAPNPFCRARLEEILAQGGPTSSSMRRAVPFKCAFTSDFGSVFWLELRKISQLVPEIQLTKKSF